MRKLSQALVLAGAITLPALLSTPSAIAADATALAAAQDGVTRHKEDVHVIPPSEYTLTANMALVSDYRFRGVSQTYKLPAVQGGIDYSHASGFYLGTWASSVSGNQYINGAGLEADIYGGYKFEVAKDLTLDLGVLFYLYPGAHYNNATKTKYDNTELYIAAAYKWFSAKYSVTTSDFFGVNKDTYGSTCQDARTGNAADCFATDPGNSKGSGYLDLAANFEVADKLTLGLHVGHQSVKNYSKLGYSDYKVSLTKDINGYLLGAAVIGTNAAKGWYTVSEAGTGATGYKKVSEPTLVLSVSRSF